MKSLKGRRMATKAQIAANRRNAEKSTGPRTDEGKAAVAQNAVKHGLSGRLDVIKGEDQAEFDQHRAAFLAELAPAGAVETMLVERIVSLSWRLDRVERMQNEVFDALLADGATPLAKLARSLAGERSEEDGEPALGRAVLKDFSSSRVLDRLLMYERRMEHSLHRTLRDLKQLRVMGYISRHMDDLDSSGPADPSQAGVADLWRGQEARDSRAGCPRHDADRMSATRMPYDADRMSATRIPYGVTTNMGDGADADRMSATRGNQYSSIPSFQDSTAVPDGSVAGELSCKTKPISADASDAEVPYGEGVTEEMWQEDIQETKPIHESGPATQAFSISEG
jgi:hypothetical protein